MRNDNDDDIVVPDIAPLESQYLKVSNSIADIEKRMQELFERQAEIQKNSHMWVLNEKSLGSIAGTIASRKPTLGEIHSKDGTSSRIGQELPHE
jgi:hypothetical protein